MMIKFGIVEWCLDRRGIDSIYRASGLGLSSIQLEVPGRERLLALSSPAVQRAYLQAAKDTGVEITGLGLNVVLRFGGMTENAGTPGQTKCLDIIKRGVDIAAAMGLDLLYMPAFAEAEMQTAADIANTAGLYRQACRAAEGSELLIGTENTLGVADNLQLFALVDHPKLRLMIDTFNPVLWGHPTSGLIKNLSHLMCRQVHVKDGVNGVMGNAPLDAGQGKFSDAAQALRSIKFTGHLLLENEYEQDVDAGVARDIAVLKQYFN
ncbi:MAG: hypothetical protein D6768_21000 [Chloroflexi bacterium]|nr:MAG: hypothetical protein D6768_21000 [Chloroflexota bacterium]